MNYARIYYQPENMKQTDMASCEHTLCSYRNNYSDKVFNSVLLRIKPLI